MVSGRATEPIGPTCLLAVPQGRAYSMVLYSMWSNAVLFLKGRKPMGRRTSTPGTVSTIIKTPQLQMSDSGYQGVALIFSAPLTLPLPPAPPSELYL